MATSETIEVGGQTVDQVYQTLMDKGVSKSDAAILVSSWIFQNTGRTQRTFDFAEAFPAVEAGCAAQFARTFHHADWLDGESVVQAGQTVGEDGFNVRFHHIETDLDALSKDVNQVFACLAELRQSLRTLLDEIKAELNRIDSDLFNHWVNPLPTPGPLPTPIGPRFPSFAGLANSAQFLGSTTLAGSDVTVWQTGQGIMMLPAVATIGVGTVTDQRLSTAGALNGLIASNPQIANDFPGAIVPHDLVQKYGSVTASDGRTLQQLVAILPGSGQYASLNDLVNDVADRQAAAVRTDRATRDAVTGALGLATADTPAANAPVERLQALPADVRAALASKGLDTVDKLANASPQQVSDAVKEAGITTSVSQAAEWTGLARTVRNIQ